MMLSLKTFLFTLVAPGTVTFLVPYFILSSRVKFLPVALGIFKFFGLLPISLGAAIYLWCAWNFISKGKGTPAPWDPPTRLVVADLYRVVRNPMYLGIAIIILGEALFFESIGMLIYAMLLPVAFHLRVIYFEEPTLKKLFGDSYNRYCEEVNRWMPKWETPQCER
ncbi:MAG: isoprenylcysteine carboxylmethyltransferase family protein [Blastocatellia bacterium]|nr:isoprenylcysteine carboxylmethyltransferase family protein [Blastocatellia bacterium]